MNFEGPNISAPAPETETSPEVKGKIKIRNLTEGVFGDNNVRRRWVFENCLSSADQQNQTPEDLTPELIKEELGKFSENIEVNPITGTLEDYGNRIERELDSIKDADDKISFIEALADFRRSSLIQGRIENKILEREKPVWKKPGETRSEFTNQDDLAVKAFVLREVSDRSLMNHFLEGRFEFFRRYEKASGRSVLDGFKSDFERILSGGIPEGDKNNHIKERQSLTEMSLRRLGWKVDQSDNGTISLAPPEIEASK